MNPTSPVTLGDLAVAGRWLRFSLVPFLALLLAGGIWAHDTNAAVADLQARQPVVDDALNRIDKRTEVLNTKVDLLLQERGLSGPNK